VRLARPDDLARLSFFLERGRAALSQKFLRSKNCKICEIRDALSRSKNRSERRTKWLHQ
jgi:hypothetical protein